MPTIHCPPLVWVPFTCLSNASAGGQLEHPSDVNSSTSTALLRHGRLRPAAPCAMPAAILLSCLYISPSAAHETHMQAGSYILVCPARISSLKVGLVSAKACCRRARNSASRAISAGVAAANVFLLAQGHQPGGGQHRQPRASAPPGWCSGIARLAGQRSRPAASCPARPRARRPWPARNCCRLSSSVSVKKNFFCQRL